MKHHYLTYYLLFVAWISSMDPVVAQERRQRTVFEPGTIVCSLTGRVADERHRLSEGPYDPYVIGVATAENNRLHIYDHLQTDGIAWVKYNSENGPIRKGDYLTSSSVPGVAMKATSSGMVLGVALEDAEKKEGLLKIRILIHYYHAER